MDSLFLTVLYNKFKLSKLIIIDLNDNKYAYNKLIIDEFNINPNSFTKNKGYRLILSKKDGKLRFIKLNLLVIMTKEKYNITELITDILILITILIAKYLIKIIFLTLILIL